MVAVRRPEGANSPFVVGLALLATPNNAYVEIAICESADVATPGIALQTTLPVRC